MIGARGRLTSMAVAAAVSAVASAAAAQFQYQFRVYEPPIHNAEYTGRFTFARIKFQTAPGGYGYCGLPAWAHGYQSCRGGIRAETSLMRIMNEISLLGPRVEDSVVLTFDDPQLSKFPVAYLAEAGFWTLNDEEAAGLRAYLLKGGFVIFDDFRDDPGGNFAWGNFEANMRRAMPEGRFIDLIPPHPVFDSFFRIEALDILPQSYDLGRPIVRGLFEDNDRGKRLMAVANYNTDVADFWEFSATGLLPVDESNEAYKVGVNYIMYALTH